MGRAGKNKAGEILGDVPEDKVFWVNDGKVLRSLSDLRNALPEISEETFKYHTGKGKNDFENWIENAVGDETLAKSISRTKSKESLLKKIDKRLSKLNSLSK